MSTDAFFFPIAFARPDQVHTAAVVCQDPQSRSDQPTGAPQSGAPQSGTPAGGGTGTSEPGAAGAGAGAGTGAPQGPCASTEMLYMMPVFLVLMWLFMIRPEQKRRKEQQTLLAAIKQGDRVVTVSGMHGVVGRLTDKTVTLRMDSGEATFDRSAVARIERDEADKPANG